MRPDDPRARERAEAARILRERAPKPPTLWIAPTAFAGGLVALAISAVLVGFARDSVLLHMVGSVSAGVLATAGCLTAARLQPLRGWARLWWLAVHNVAAVALALTHALFISRRLL